MEIYVGNLPYAATATDVAALFEPFGAPEVNLMTDRATGRSRGFAFVTMPDEAAARAAIAALNGRSLDGRALRVDEAAGPSRPQWARRR
ncbi:MAG: RNA-binding protein [Acidobacteria bacterium]|nr:RNA-binding protein [Acidobacteriota bacterium]